MPSLKIFKLFTNDATGSPPDPDTATTSVVIPFPRELITGQASPIITHPNGMGSHFEMLDGTVKFQDFGIAVNMAGGEISISNNQPDMTFEQVTNIYSMYVTIGEYFYFSDSTDIYKVRFKRNPAGFTFFKQYIVHESIGYTRFSFTLDLVIEEKLT